MKKPQMSGASDHEQPGESNPAGENAADGSNEQDRPVIEPSVDDTAVELKPQPGAEASSEASATPPTPEAVAPAAAASQPGFARSGRAFQILAGALREDVGAAWQRGADRRAKAVGVLKRSAQKFDAARSDPRIKTASAHVAALFGNLGGGLSGVFRRLSLRRHPGSFRFGSWKVLALTALSGLVIVAGFLFWALKDVPWQEIADGSLKPVIVLETANGQPLVRQGPFQGPYARYENFPPHLVDAVLSIEDRRFFEHYGIDIRGILRALLRNVQAGQVVQGGSTITQQLIKTLYLESDRTLKRKIQETVVAFWLEWKLGKPEILTRYLNAAYLGAGATGMPAAARVYFDKDIGQLDLRESAMLAGLLKAPSQLNPIDNFEGARERTTVVFDAMVDNGKLKAEDATAAKEAFAALHVTTPSSRSGSWFADWVSTQAREIAGSTPGSITVRTTLVPRLQQAAEEIVRRALDEEGKALGVSQAALVAMTPDGAVVAMVGGHDYASSQFNRAVTAMRQPGSTFKLFVYYAALKQGYSLRDAVIDGPVDIDGWSPENAGGNFRGRVSLAEAFARSLNAATVRLAMEAGIENVAAAANELGIDAALTRAPALALGASEVSLLDLTGAYASVRAGRAPIEPWGVIEFQAEAQPRAFRLGPQIKPSADISRYQPELVALLRLAVERGTGRGAALDGFAAGKTGTSQNNRDAWFVGFTEPLVAGVWVGNDDGTPMNGVTGGALPARIWREFMTAALTEPTPRMPADNGASASGQDTAPACNIRACSRTYRSFRVSDCTYQPYQGGPRRLCER